MFIIHIAAATAQTNMTTNGAYSFTGQIWQQPCTLADAVNITIPANACPNKAMGTGTFIISPTQTRVLAFPSGLNAGGGQDITVINRHPAGVGLNLASGWHLPSSVLANGQPQWSPGAAEDGLTCRSMTSKAADAHNGLIMWCPDGVAQDIIAVTPLSPTGPPVIKKPSLASITAVNYGGPNNTQNGATSLTLSGDGSTLVLTAGDTLVVYDGGMGAVSKPNFLSPTVSGATIGPCVAGKNTRIAPSTNYVFGTELQLCPITASGTATVTGHWDATARSASFVAMDWHNLNPTTPDAGIGNTANGGSGGTTAAVSTNGGGTSGQTYAYVASIPNGVGVAAGPSGWTQIVNSATLGWQVYYEIVPSGSVISASATLNSASGWNASIWAGTP